MAVSATTTSIAMDLESLHNDCEAAANRAIAKAYYYRRASRFAMVFAAVSALSCIPLVTWQIRQTDRVWRMRNGIKVRNHRVMIGVCGTLSGATIMFLSSPIGFLAQHDAAQASRCAIDALGWNALVLAGQCKRLEVGVDIAAADLSRHLSAFGSLDV